MSALRKVRWIRPLGHGRTKRIAATLLGTPLEGRARIAWRERSGVRVTTSERWVPTKQLRFGAMS